jgi:flagellin
VANKFRNDVAEISQGVANGNDAVAQLQIMDGGMSNISSILDRLKTLATQSGSASFTGDRAVLNNEFQTDISEIDRQSQAVGLNTGGTFAKSLAIYLGGGKGTSSASILNNGTVSVDLTKSTVDAQSLGLKGVQAVNLGATVAADYDLGKTSASSVQAILADVANNGVTTATSFTFMGPGFGDTSKGITVNVNLNGVADTAGLVDQVNKAISTAAQAATGNAAAFNAANITATIHTDALGKQQLAFSSSSAAFQVSSGDKVASALMGSFNGAVAATAGNNAGFTQISGGAYELGTAAATNTETDLTWGTDQAVADSQVVSISANDATGKAHSISVTLGAAGSTLAQALTSINNTLQASNDSTLQQITAVNTSAGATTSLNFISTLPGFTVSVGTNNVAGEGITTGTGASQQALQVGAGSSADISTLQGATNAVSAVSTAVAALGTAQAAIGKGQNQLNYAISLAQSQITNFSAAASQIRDTDVAQQAANLTKAQVLQQATIAAMAQANSAPQAVLKLLQG